MEIYVFNKNLEFQGIIDIFTSLQWTRRYYEKGEFELHCAITTDNLNLLKRDYVIWKKGDTEAGYIEYRNLKQDKDGKEELVVKGKFLIGYLDRRIIWSTENLNSTVEVVMRTLVNDNCINPTDTNRIIPNMILGDLKGYTETLTKQVSYDNLLETLETIGTTYDLGYRINFDTTNKKLVFEVYRGLDRTVNQSTNSIAIFSKEFDNILEQEYTDSLNNYKNLALVGGVGEGSARKMVTIGTATGLDRFEIFVDAKDTSNTTEDELGNTMTLTDTEYNSLLTEKGTSTLAEYTEIQTFDSTINVNSNLTYKTDYDLGDKVTCISKKWEIVVDARLTEIKEIYEEDGFSIDITFGDEVPTLINKIKQLIK